MDVSFIETDDDFTHIESFKQVEEYIRRPGTETEVKSETKSETKVEDRTTDTSDIPELKYDKLIVISLDSKPYMVLQTMEEADKYMKDLTQTLLSVRTKDIKSSYSVINGNAYFIYHKKHTHDVLVHKIGCQSVNASVKR